tara:strand:- start:1060 stop:1623 length:564 start_codon:yes stop_codon:yes gene_type:complete
MGTCELCGSEGVGTRKATVSNAILDCCSRCISSNNLEIVHIRKEFDKSVIQSSQITGKGIIGVDIMSQNSIELAHDFHNRVRMAREQKGLSQNDLAKRINEKVAIVQKIEDGTRPTDSLLKKISKELGIQLFFERTSENYRHIPKTKDRGMTISDASENSTQKKPTKKRKKKGRRLGVSRSGPRKRS